MLFYMACLSLIASIPSCKKSEVIPRQVPSQTPQTPQTQTFSMLVGNWEKGTGEVYTATLKGIIDYRNAAHVRVYLRVTNSVILISSGGIVFMNGHLHAGFNNTDIQLVYQYFGIDGQIPFSNLNIIVVVHG